MLKIVENFKKKRLKRIERSKKKRLKRIFKHELLPGLFAYYCDLVDMRNKKSTEQIEKLDFTHFEIAFKGMSEGIDTIDDLSDETFKTLKRTVEKIENKGREAKKKPLFYEQRDRDLFLKGLRENGVSWGM